MADKSSFAEIIVSQLGQPREPFGWGDIATLTVLAVVLAAYLAAEQGFARLLVLLFRRRTGSASRGEKPPPDEEKSSG